jgi:molecular chaperone Hsp33
MSDNDRLYRFIIENTRVRGELVRLNATWQAILERADYPPNVRNILGEAMAACTLLAATIKFQGSLIMQIRGDGPLHLLVAQASSQRTLRGIARWNDDVPDHDLQAIFGNAQMVVTMEPEEGDAYQGIIELKGDSLKEAIEHYFMQSEQLNTALWLACDDEVCAGFLLQELPGADLPEEDWNHARILADTLSQNELLELDAKQILLRLYHEDDVRLFDPEPISFRCGCSRERIGQVLVSLGHQEVQDILQEQGKIEVDCEFCNAHYEFDPVDAEALFATSNPPDVPSTKH